MPNPLASHGCGSQSTKKPRAHLSLEGAPKQAQGNEGPNCRERVFVDYGGAPAKLTELRVINRGAHVFVCVPRVIN